MTFLQNFRTYHLAVAFRRECQPLKLSSPSLKDQLSRASESIVLNLAEGSAKPTAKDRLRYYSIAFASMRECQSILHLEEIDQLAPRSEHLAASLYRLTHPRA